LLSHKSATEKTENLALPPLKETADITDLTMKRFVVVSPVSESKAS